MKIKYVVRIVMKNVFKRKSNELGSLAGWGIAPAFLWIHHKAPGKSLRLPGTQVLSCETQGALGDLSLSNFTTLNAIHMFAWIYESVKPGIFQKII